MGFNIVEVRAVSGHFIGPQGEGKINLKQHARYKNKKETLYKLDRIPQM